MTDSEDFSLGAPAEAVYKAGITNRETVIDRGREVAKVTIPSLVPPQGYREGDKLYTPHQSIGARGVNNIAARLLLTLMPPERPLFSHQIPDGLVEEMQALAEQEGGGGDDGILSKVQLAMSKRALEVTARADTTPLRAVLYEALRLLTVAGNCLLDYETIDTPVVHPVSKYVVKRDRKGQALYVILEEHTAWVSLPQSTRELVSGLDQYKAEMEKPEHARTIPVYKVCRRLPRKGKAPGMWAGWQECGGKLVPGSEGRYPADAPPLFALWMVPNYGFDWGRAYADEYIGDLLSVENLAKAVLDGAGAAALSLLFVRPGSRTRLDQVAKAKNLDVLAGDAADVTMFRTDKQGDFRFVSESLQATIDRLGWAFLLNSSIQRHGERVTAEEIKMMARELDQTMGGIYAIFASSLQGYVVSRLIYLMESTGELKKLPPLGPNNAKVRIRIATGIDALGNSREVELLDEFMAPLLQIPEAMAQINLADYMRRKAVGLGINPDGLIKTDTQVADETATMQNDMMRSQVIDKGTGPAINALASLGKAGMQQPGGLDPSAIPPEMLQQLAEMAQQATGAGPDE